MCKNTEIKDVTISKDGNSLETKNSEGNMTRIYFDDKCWGQCNNDTNIKTTISNNINNKSNFFVITLIITSVFVLFLILILILVIKNHD